ncbi:hypothetical protein KGF57_000250 [Candida theae]|uniref:MARVEL domain-containing protein n=1 Tax=Candida theae TaxID=1198502 RepID=A0AAD5BJ95_9ASCO|nr:uncharacterized protein KGF57_000250 [Candida theae]KAI5968130.1 hypothetical protein KGF57_000250 [Candida theae]
MNITKRVTSIILRVVECAFAVIVLGLSAGVLAGFNANISRVSFNLVVAIFNIIWIAYVAFIAPIVLANQTPTAVVFAVQVIFWVFYLAGWAAIADAFPSDCNWWFFSRDSESTCRAYQAILPFSLLNWFWFSLELALFIGYSFVPEIKTLGSNHLLTNTTYYWGTVFNAEATTSKGVGGLNFTDTAGVGKEGVVADGGDDGIIAPHLDDEAAVGNGVSDENAYNTHGEEESKVVTEGSDTSDHHQQAGLEYGSRTNGTIPPPTHQI